MAASNEPRYISADLFNRLDSLEKIVAMRFIIEGRWVVMNEVKE